MAGYCKYYKQKKQVSYDNGVTYQDVIPYEYQKGDLYEADSNDCGYIPPIPPSPTGYAGQYLTFRTLESGAFTFSGRSISYSLDSGSTWASLADNTSTPTVASGTTIMWKASGLTSTTTSNIGTFSSTGRFEAEGNIMSMASGDSFASATVIIRSFQFQYLFRGCTGLTSAENLILPATTLKPSCYDAMFAGCTNLTTAPELPTTTERLCYWRMFSGCTSLTAAPALPATTLEYGCYVSMFEGCTSLTSAPALPATRLMGQCYDSMFYGCTGLTTAPSLPATVLAMGCYGYMFANCTSLTTAPSLPATTMERDCYSGMFQGCTNLTTAPDLPATTLATYCYMNMFSGCTNLNSIKCLATNISSYRCTTNWVDGVAATGTFAKNINMNNWTRGSDGIPNGWTVVDGY